MGTVPERGLRVLASKPVRVCPAAQAGIAATTAVAFCQPSMRPSKRAISPRAQKGALCWVNPG